MLQPWIEDRREDGRRKRGLFYSFDQKQPHDAFRSVSCGLDALASYSLSDIQAGAAQNVLRLQPEIEAEAHSTFTAEHFGSAMPGAYIS